MGNTCRNIRPEYMYRSEGFFGPAQGKEKIMLQCQACRGKALRHSTEAEECYKIASDRSELFKELGSTQEESDRRLLLATCHAGRNGFTTVGISSDVTDAFLRALAFKSVIRSLVYITCGTQTRARYIDITHVGQRHGSEVCRYLAVLHAFTGCDTPSAFFRKRQMSAQGLTRRHMRLRELFQLVDRDWDVLNEVFSRLQGPLVSCTAQIRERRCQ